MKRVELRCPECDSPSIEVIPHGAATRGMLVFRRHQCRDCGKKPILSVQMILATEAQMEEAMELAIRHSTSSDRTPNDRGTLGLLDSLST